MIYYNASDVNKTVVINGVSVIIEPGKSFDLSGKVVALTATEEIELSNGFEFDYDLFAEGMGFSAIFVAPAIIFRMVRAFLRPATGGWDL